jgi:hypothetical protein
LLIGMDIGNAALRASRGASRFDRHLVLSALGQGYNPGRLEHRSSVSRGEEGG